MTEKKRHMGSTWSSDSDASQQTVEAVQAGLTVRLIMTERRELMTCCLGDEVALLAKKNVGRFSFVPVVRRGRICGL